jgi:hypothetical protein
MDRIIGSAGWRLPITDGKRGYLISAIGMAMGNSLAISPNRLYNSFLPTHGETGHERRFGHSRGNL